MNGARVRTDAAIAAALFVVALALQLPIADRWLAYTDEGLVLQTAAEIGRGKVMYRDVIIPGPGPVAFYALAALFRLTGPSFAASRVAIAVVSAAMAVLVYLLARAVAGRWAAALAGVGFLACRVWAFPHWLFFHYSSFAVFLATATAVLLIDGLRRDRVAPTLVAGAAGGLAGLCRQDVGAATLAALGVATLVAGGPRRWTHAAGFAVGAVVVAVPILAYFAMQGALEPLVDQTVLTPFRGRLQGLADVLYLRRPPVLPLLGPDPALRARMAEYAPAILVTLHWDAITQSTFYRSGRLWDAGVKLAYVLPAVVLALAAVVVAVGWRRGDRGRWAGGVVLVAHGAALLAAFNPPQDWVHLLVLYHPTLALGALLVDRVATGLGRLGRVVLGATTLVVGGALVGALVLTRDLRATFATPVHAPAGTVYLKTHEAHVLDDLLRYVADASRPGEPLPVMPYHPVIQFLALRPSGMSSSYFWPVRPRSDTDARLIAELEASRPRVLVYSPSQYGDLGTFRDRFPELFAYLVAHYEIVRTFTPPTPWGLIFCALGRRGDPPPPPAVDLMGAVDQATVASATPGDRNALAGRALWPFRPVVYERPAAPGETRLTWTLAIPAHARLHFAYGFNPDRYVSLTPSAVTFAVMAAAPGKPEQRVFRAVVDAQRDPSQREWREADVDLDGFEGESATLSLVTAADNAGGTRSDVAGWSDLGLTVRAR